MERGRLFKFGGLAAGIVLILFGIGSLAISIDAGMTVKDELSAEKIVGSPDMSPEGIAPGVEEAGLEDVEIPDCDVAEEEIWTRATRPAASRSTCASMRSSRRVA